jgi:hypothetical protein
LGCKVAGKKEEKAIVGIELVASGGGIQPK